MGWTGTVPGLFGVVSSPLSAPGFSNLDCTESNPGWKTAVDSNCQLTCCSQHVIGIHNHVSH